MASSWNRGRWIVAAGFAAIAVAGCKSAPPIENEIPESPPASAGGTAKSDPWASTPVEHEAPIAETANPAASNRVHVVKKGDTLFSLARHYYDDQSKWRKIFEANRDKIANKDEIKVGQTIVIPD